MARLNGYIVLVLSANLISLTAAAAGRYAPPPDFLQQEYPTDTYLVRPAEPTPSSEPAQLQSLVQQVRAARTAPPAASAQIYSADRPRPRPSTDSNGQAPAQPQVGSRTDQNPLFSQIQSMVVQSQSEAQPGRLNDHLYNDIRDIQKYSKDLPSTATFLMRQLTADPARFVGVTDVSYSETGPRGPSPSLDDPTLTNANGISYYNIAKEYPETLKNTILYAGFDKEITELVVNQDYDTYLTLFVHSNQYKQQNPASNGYFFRRMHIRIEWSKRSAAANESQILTILSTENDIPLNATNFQVMGVMIDRKVILEDFGNKIWIVLPVGVGSLDIRPSASNSAPLSVSITTGEINNPSRPARFVKHADPTSDGSSSNTRRRIIPDYYAGRPFLGIRYSDGTYTEIGMHYQIDSFLTRGFVSHGCIRVRDKDLYVLDAIVNEGPQKSVPVKIVNQLPEYAAFDNLMKKENSWYSAVSYTTKPALPVAPITCPGTAQVFRQYVYADGMRHSNPNDGAYHTYPNLKECLFQTGKVTAPADPLNPNPDIVSPILEYMVGLSRGMPLPLTDSSPFESLSEGGAERDRLDKAIECVKNPKRGCPKVIQGFPDDPSKTPAQRIANMDNAISFHEAVYEVRCSGRNRKTTFCKNEKDYLKKARGFRQYLQTLLPPGAIY